MLAIIIRLEQGSREFSQEPIDGGGIGMVIKQVDEADFKAWLGLRIALWPDHTLDELTDDQSEIAQNPDMPVFLAWSGDDGENLGEAIGMIEMAIRAHAPGSEDAAVPYVEGWYVVPAWQGRGVGRALMETGEGWARGRGFTRIASDTIPLTYPTSPAAHKALGYSIAAEYPAGVIEDEPSMHFIKEFS
jgi:aminoglycoside 6'-N-acetyltransferase I